MLGREEASFLARGEARQLAHGIATFIRDHGINNVDKHIDIVFESNSYKVKAWSEESDPLFGMHDCWMIVTITSVGGNNLKIRMVHCGHLRSLYDWLCKHFAK